MAIYNSVSAFAVDDGTTILDAPGYKIPFAADICTECASMATLATDMREERARDFSNELNSILESSPSGGPIETDCRNPYPGSGRLNTLAPD